MNNCIRTSGMFHIMLIRLCKVDPFRPHLYMHIVIQRFIRVYLNEGVLTSTHNEREKVYFYLKIANFFSHKSSSILNRHVNILSDVSRVANKFFNGNM